MGSCDVFSGKLPVFLDYLTAWQGPTFHREWTARQYQVETVLIDLDIHASLCWVCATFNIKGIEEETTEAILQKHRILKSFPEDERDFKNQGVWPVKDSLPVSELPSGGLHLSLSYLLVLFLRVLQTLSIAFRRGSLWEWESGVPFSRKPWAPVRMYG